MCTLQLRSVVFWLGIISLSTADHLDDILRSYDTLHSRDLDIHHVAKRSLDLENLFRSELSVEFCAFGSVFRLRLYQAKGLFSNKLIVAEVGENETVEIYLNENEFYTGFLNGESRDLKVFAYMEKENLVATFKTRNDTFFIEPSHGHLPESGNYTMIVYRLSDVKGFDVEMPENRVSYCSPPGMNDSFPVDAQSSTLFSAAAWHMAGRTEERRVKRDNGATNTVCSLMLVADYRFFDIIGQSSATITAKYMIGVLNRVNNIYTNTDFGNNYGPLGFEIEGILVHTSPTSTSNHYNMQTTTWDTSGLLNAFSRLSVNADWDKYCLAHLFTATAFANGVLGLAWVASDKVGSLGGICSPCSGDNCYNTGWSTSLNKFQNKLTTLEADLVTAHELGHGWGAQHDPDRTECSPSSSGNGKFIMYPYSVSGLDGNNNKFSPCSRTSIAAVLRNKKDSCFVAPRNSFCGNYRVEDGEDCDAGPDGRAGSDRCCDSQCRFVAGVNCSDANSDCCQNCTFAPPTKLCWKSNIDNYLSLSCRNDSYCTGTSITCPVTTQHDGTPCSNNGQCRNGTCQDVCEYSGLISCVCDDVSYSCVWCCKDSPNGTCRPNFMRTSNSSLNLGNGYPCKQGYCQSGKCVLSITTTSNRVWIFIQQLSVNELLLFMRNNLVLATVILTLIPYLVFCIIICVLDCKKQRKRKQQQAWLHKTNDQLTLDNKASHVTRVEGVISRRPQGQ